MLYWTSSCSGQCLPAISDDKLRPMKSMFRMVLLPNAEHFSTERDIERKSEQLMTAIGLESCSPTSNLMSTFAFRHGDRL